ncbi:family 10 glycosylhydrolase [Candidatus Sumerlaeota bacterium]|nr:family 10 glycosylhydrolase [Candidatus Sumerlaeota bacterium]
MSLSIARIKQCLIMASLCLLAPLTVGAADMKAVWVSTYLNIDWPSKPGLPAQTQIAELDNIMNTAVQTGFNTIILQVRSECDALYQSPIEPWSRVLTGKDGGDPGYDPLATACKMAHAKGLKLHAWINPYRAGATKHRGDYTRKHITRSSPGAVRTYGKFFWCDPSSPAAKKQTLAVVSDIVSRYDIDGIHYDDYFYPYKESGKNFPDSENFAAYKKAGGEMGLADWRRANINEMVKNIYSVVKSIKPGVEVGISPFGIWKSGVPAGVTGMSQYDELYADPLLWMQQGWCDYISPQLYWAIDSKQPFETLLKWWAANKKNSRVKLVPGIGAYRIVDSKWPVQEVMNQIKICKKTRGCDGYCIFSMKTIMNNSGGLATALGR